jgi:hypothetical protein
MEPPLDLERFATLSAELNAGTQRDELCAREGISLADWNASQEAWLARLADETAGKRFVLTNRYNNAFVARRRALTHGPRFPAHKPAAARKVDPVAPPPVEVAPPPVVVVSLPALAAEPPPIYRQPEAPPPVYRAPEPPPTVYREPEPPAPHRAPKAATMALPAFTEPMTATLPFAPALPGAKTEGPSVAQSMLAKSRMALPFKPAGPAEPSAAPPVAPAPAHAVDLTESSTITGASPFAPSAPVLPFQPAPAASAPAPAPAKRPSSPPPALDGGATIYNAVSPFASPAAALPFATAAAPPRPAPPHAGGGLPFHQAAAAAPPPVAPAPAAAPVAPAAPPPSAPGATKLTLEQFASLTAEIAVSPRAAAQIRARYGFDEAAHRAEAEEHNRRFNADPALLARYMELFQAYREYVARAPR